MDRATVTTWFEVVGLLLTTAGFALTSYLIFGGPWGVVAALFMAGLLLVAQSGALTALSRPRRVKVRDM